MRNAMRVWVRAYLDRWNEDIRLSGIALATSLAALMPTLVLGFGLFSVFPVLFVVLAALFIVFFGTALTAISRRLVWKALVYMVAMAWLMWVFREQVGGGLLEAEVVAPVSGTSDTTRLVVLQILYLFPLFYLGLVWWQRRRHGGGADR